MIQSAQLFGHYLRLLAQAEARARTILEQYVRNVLGDDAKNWTIEFKDVQ